MKFFILFLLLTLVSCSSVFTQPAKMLSPEAQGMLGLMSVEARLAQYKREGPDFPNNNHKRPVRNSVPVGKITFGGELGLARRLDLYSTLNFLTSNAPNTTGLKVQFLGQPRLDAKKGNFSSSIFAGVGKANGGASDGSDMNLWNNNIDRIHYGTSQIEYGLITGYRWRDDLVQYLSASYFEQKVSGNVDTDDGVLKDHNFHYTQFGMAYSLGLIYYFDKMLYWKMDYTYMTSALDYSHTETTHAGAAAIGYYY